MSSRRTVRQVLAAVLVGLLVGGGLMAVTPAGAEVSSAMATSWKKIWKKELRPLADKRYATKKGSDAAYQPKGSYALAGSGYTKAETYSKAEADAKYQPKGSYAPSGSSYTKAESDAKYAPYPTVVRGTFIEVANSATLATEDISFGVTLGQAPTVNIIQPGAAAPAGCAGGTVAAPSAQPGNFCLFLRYSSADNVYANTSTLASGSSTFGTIILASRAAAGYLEISGSWAVRPSAGGITTSTSTKGEAGSDAPATSVR
jgi:hypothetical protein